MNTKLDMKHDSGIVVYIAIIAMGKYEDYIENNIFCSIDKTKVENWVNRLNKIIEDNTERIKKYDNYTKEQPFWGDYIYWENPVAIMQEVPIR